MPGYCCESDIRHPEKIARAQKAMPSELELLDASELLKVLADPNRMRLIAALLEVELCVCDLSEFLGLSQSAVSHQLRILRQSRLVRHRRDGKNAYYSLKDNHVEQIVQTALQHVREMYQPDAEE
ncbi:MAG TPA: transcriptional regulator [Clostridiales bacterium]|nr:transcriptional regulator [Clostridiales bacterium]